jgi:hypothetical protein
MLPEYLRVRDKLGYLYRYFKSRAWIVRKFLDQLKSCFSKLVCFLRREVMLCLSAVNVPM